MAFLAFEGIDGSGKSTLISGLKNELARQSVSVWVTREPGGTPAGDEIRKIILSDDLGALHPRTELLLYEAGRAQHVEYGIRPAIERGDWVLCDRFSASSLAFQVGGRGLEESTVEWLNQYAVQDCQPDLWVLLDLPIEVSHQRMQKRVRQGQDKDRFEREEGPFHQRIRQYYLKLAKESPDKWLVLEAQKPPEALLEELVHRLKESQLWP